MPFVDLLRISMNTSSAAPSGQADGKALGVARGLNFYALERGALFFRFDHAPSFAVQIHQVVGKAMTVVEEKFANATPVVACMFACFKPRTCQPATCKSWSIWMRARASGVMQIAITNNGYKNHCMGD